MKVKSKICIIDDDENVLNSLSMLLKSIGIESETFSNGLDFLENIPSSPVCLLLDIVLVQREHIKSKTQ